MTNKVSSEESVIVGPITAVLKFLPAEATDLGYELTIINSEGSGHLRGSRLESLIGELGSLPDTLSMRREFQHTARWVFRVTLKAPPTRLQKLLFLTRVAAEYQ